MSDCALVMVTKNRIDLTAKCLESLFLSDQNSLDYDIIIVDNGSSPESISELKKLAKTSHSIKNIYVLGSSVPMPFAFNLGMLMAQDYSYRIKMDNDLLVPSFSTSGYRPPQTTAENPGAPAVVGFTVGAGASKYSPKISGGSRHTRFIDHMKDVIKNQKVGIAALVPIRPKTSLNDALLSASVQKFQGMACLIGSCMMIPKETFDKIGYFHEGLTRKIDVEYSQRAMLAGMNIGYATEFGLMHQGIDAPADGALFSENDARATTFLYKNKTSKDYVSTAWLPYYDQIKKSSKNFIVNISDASRIFSGQNG